MIAAFPYFGGKRAVVPDAWKRLGFAPSLGRVAAYAPHIGAVKNVLPYGEGWLNA